VSGKPAKSQRERFIEAAREHETDDSPEEFERVFAKVVPPKRVGATSRKTVPKNDQHD
jgi:hypothetical protein